MKFWIDNILDWTIEIIELIEPSELLWIYESPHTGHLIYWIPLLIVTEAIQPERFNGKQVNTRNLRSTNKQIISRKLFQRLENEFSSMRQV